ncbi:MAG TPA: DNA polymerase IV [Bacteroidales bacterium]|nr:DNA polymerase IV [Bacteroidales bacterium]HOR81845.1 DNA polymerase IV [Bacteroidales bacterium]HPJ90922.1 DNA polymerase IV [Bacteroidales bacterium]
MLSTSKKYRKIIHIDMDAFYASVEQRDHPEWRGKPLVVGSSHSRGVIAAASYEARKFGIRSAMPSKKALQLCPYLIFAPHRFDIYKSVSREIHAIFSEYTDLIEPLSLDEAFLDVTENKFDIPLAQDIAKEIKRKIQLQLNLTASAGVSYNKFLAKIASDMQKPDGLTVIHPIKALKVIENLPIEAFWGVGRVTAKRMHKLGIHTGKELREQSESFLVQNFGKIGKLFAEFAQGNDHRAVETDRERLSVGCEQTFEEDLMEKEQIIARFDDLADELEKRIEKANFQGYTFTLKIKRGDFKQITRSQTAETCFTSTMEFIEPATRLLETVDLENHGVRLIGFTVSNPAVEEVTETFIDPQLLIPFEPY